MTTECQWFAKCHNPSVAVAEHPTIGDVEICQEHIDWVNTDFSPTKLVPPLAARHYNKVQTILADNDLLDDDEEEK